MGKEGGNGGTLQEEEGGGGCGEEREEWGRGGEGEGRRGEGRIANISCLLPRARGEATEAEVGRDGTKGEQCERGRREEDGGGGKAERREAKEEGETERERQEKW